MKFLFRPIDIAPLIFFRVFGGSLIAIETIGELFTSYGTEYLHEGFHFSYYLTPWLEPWPPLGIYAHFTFNIIMAIMIAIGYKYRWACLGYAIGASSIFLMEKCVYINHTYLYCLLTLVLAFMPANRAWSVDAKLDPSIKQSTAPFWTIGLLRAQLGIVYVYAGMAKVNPDWLMAYPLKIWLPVKKHYYVIGPLLEQEWWAWVMSYGGAAFDLFIIFFLLWPLTRKWAFFTALAFHFTNVCVFGVGTFPWLSMVLTSMFLPPSSFRKITFLNRKLPAFNREAYRWPKVSEQRLIAAILGIYVLIQVLVPARQWLYPGNNSWHEAGHNFSWHMMLRGKTGRLTYTLKDPDSGKQWVENIGPYLTRRQYSRMIGKPDMIWEFAQFLAEKYRAEGYPNIQVFASCKVRLNGRPAQEMVDTNVDLAQEPRQFGMYLWVLPLGNWEIVDGKWEKSK